MLGWLKDFQQWFLIYKISQERAAGDATADKASNIC